MEEDNPEGNGDLPQSGENNAPKYFAHQTHLGFEKASRKLLPPDDVLCIKPKRSIYRSIYKKNIVYKITTINNYYQLSRSACPRSKWPICELVVWIFKNIKKYVKKYIKKYGQYQWIDNYVIILNLIKFEEKI